MIDDRDNDATDGVPEAPGAEEAADVGYGRPPRSHRFKPGRSGNTRGRPKGARGRRSMVERVLFERRSVDLDGSGRLQKTTTLELVVLALRQRALEGDNRAFRQFKAVEARFGDQEPAIKKAGYLMIPNIGGSWDEWVRLFGPKDVSQADNEEPE